MYETGRVATPGIAAMIADGMFGPEYPGSEGLIRCMGHLLLFFTYGGMRPGEWGEPKD